MTALLDARFRDRLGPEECIVLVIVPAFRGEDRAGETDDENEGSEDSAPRSEAASARGPDRALSNPFRRLCSAPSLSYLYANGRRGAPTHARNESRGRR
jgi:hypothetical protein